MVNIVPVRSAAGVIQLAKFVTGALVFVEVCAQPEFIRDANNQVQSKMFSWSINSESIYVVV